jgi:hypothetical protein
MVDRGLGWTMTPCYRTPATLGPHFTDPATGYNDCLDDVVLTCAETLAAIPEAAAAMEECIAANGGSEMRRFLKKSELTFGGLAKSVQSVRWDKVSKAAADLVKEKLPSEGPVDFPHKVLKDLKYEFDHPLDRFQEVEWDKVPELAMEYVVDKIATQDEARSAFASAKEEVRRQIDLIEDIDWETLPLDIKNGIVERIPTKDELRQAIEREKLELVDTIKRLPEALGNLKARIEKDPEAYALLVARYGVSAAVSALAFGPVARLLGFGGTGIGAGKSHPCMRTCPEANPGVGSAAAAFQSKFGTPFVFRAVQSYAMSGWGVPVVNSAVSAAGLLTMEAVDLARRNHLDEVGEVGDVCIWTQKFVLVMPPSQCSLRGQSTQKETRV